MTQIGVPMGAAGAMGSGMNPLPSTCTMATSLVTFAAKMDRIGKTLPSRPITAPPTPTPEPMLGLYNECQQVTNAPAEVMKNPEAPTYRAGVLLAVVNIAT